MSTRKILFLLPFFILTGCSSSENKPSGNEGDSIQTAGNKKTDSIGKTPGLKDVKSTPEIETFQSEQRDTIFKMEIADDNTQFTIKNIGKKGIEELQFKTYPPPLSNNILMGAHSFSKDLGTLEKNSSVSIRRTELRNSKGRALSEYKWAVGVIWMGCKIDGKRYGGMFTNEGGSWLRSSPDIEWGIVMSQILDEPKEPESRKLNVKFADFGDKVALYLIENKEDYPVDNLTVTIFPLRKSDNTLDTEKGFSIKFQTLEKNETKVLDPADMKNEKGELLSKSGIKIGFIKISGTISGEEKSVMYKY